jgi:hypothetical protein
VLASADASGGGGAAALDLHEGIDDPPADPAAGGCPRWPEHQRLLSSQGELVRGRCRATNLCAYCARLFAVETSEMLALDAMEHAPGVYAVLTARELLDRPVCRRHLTQLRRALVKRWPAIEWAVLIEFQRRGALHLNLLIKGVPTDDVAELHARMAAIWCRRVDAEPQAQFVGEISDAGGLVRYVTQHFMKPAQAPPIGWRGHRYSATRGYLVRPAAQMREEARSALRAKRALVRALQAGHEGHEAERAAHQALELAAATSWRLYVLPAAALCPGVTASGRAQPDRSARADRSTEGAEQRRCHGCDVLDASVNASVHPTRGVKSAGPVADGASTVRAPEPGYGPRQPAAARGEPRPARR